MKKITKEMCIKDLKEVREKMSKIPTKDEYAEYGTYGKNTVLRKFGSWNKSLMATFGEINQIRGEESVDTVCSTCGKKMRRQASSITSENVFCSNSCSATYNNKKTPKRKKTKKCRACKTLILSGYTYCDDCCSKGKHLHGGRPLSERTLEEVIQWNKINKHQVVRSHASQNSKHLPYTCAICGYSEHVEVCHIKEIHKFPLTATLAEINHKNNLVKLCRNHHWEMDHGILNDADKKKLGLVGFEPTTKELT